MSDTITPEKHEFQAEIAQLLDLVVHSLYTDKEIFVRELISNAADASEKLRFLKTSGVEIADPDKDLRITITTDETAKTITFTDAGLGMTREELIGNLGTIAHSGSRAFLQQLKEKAAGGPVDATLIGQFGVGFYSAFMVADKVVVHSRSYTPGAQGWSWTSDGRSNYELEPVDGLTRGTQIVVHLKEGTDFASEWMVKEIIKKYSNFVQFPIDLNGTEVNTVQALWTRNKNEVKPEEYDEFYKYLGHDTEAPLYRLHFMADAPLSIRSLLFVPARSRELATMSREESSVDLYCKKILIQHSAKGLFPDWCRFLRGVVDSEDLPLNISRETMQDSALLAKIREVLVKRFLKFLEEEAKLDSEKYAKFFLEHGHCLKEGVTNDWSHREALAKLLRFDSSATEAGKLTSLADYIARMPEGQSEIYYITAATREGAEASAFYEVFREKKWEVLFLSDARDEFVLDHLREFEGKKLVAAERADVKLDKENEGLSEEAATALAAFVKESLGDKVGEVRTSKRLASSPIIALNGDSEVTTNMRRMLRAMKRDSEMPPAAKPDLEINPAHPLVVSLEKTRHSDADLARQISEQLHDQALAAAGLLDDPRAMLGRMTALLEKLCGTAK